MSGSFEIDDDVQITSSLKAERGKSKPSTEGREFWTLHAAYWRERGNESRALECEAEARKLLRVADHG